jgi:carboxypeptidase Q
LKPYKKIIPILGLFPSVSTPEEGITAEIIAVNGFEELKSVGDATNKIIVFNQPFDNPEDGIKYRQYSAIKAAKLGAVATLVRSYVTFTLGNPHTGLMFYEHNGSIPIPSAELSIEDADLLYRLYKKGSIVKLTFF